MSRGTGCWSQVGMALGESDVGRQHHKKRERYGGNKRLKTCTGREVYDTQLQLKRRLYAPLG
jgi:hypothetical protein